MKKKECPFAVTNAKPIKGMILDIKGEFPGHIEIDMTTGFITASVNGEVKTFTTNNVKIIDLLCGRVMMYLFTRE